MQTMTEQFQGFRSVKFLHSEFSSQFGKKYLQNLTSYFRTEIHFSEALQLSPDSEDDKSPVSFRQTEAL